jgi:hypothetical protein
MSDLRHPPDSDHPDDLLAGLVDGTLTAAERAEVQAHLDGCEHCRAEVAQAERAARALRELPERDTPWGLGREAIEEARKGVRGPRGRRLAAVAGIAAAAVVLVGLAIGVLRGPQADQSSAPAVPSGAAQPAAGGAENGTGASRNLVTHEQTNYDGARIDRLAASFAVQSKDAHPPPAPKPTAPLTTGGSSTGGSSTGGATTGTTGPATSGAAPDSSSPSIRSASQDRAGDYVSCIDKAAGYEASARPVHVIVARFEEKPALIGIFLHGPGAGQPADLVVVWVSSPQCEFLHYASHRIAP